MTPDASRPHTPITVPPDWTAEKDLEALEDRWDDCDNYFETAIEHVADGYSQLESIITRALNYYDQRPIYSLPGIIDLKLAWLTGQIADQEHRPQTVERFNGDIAYCRFALAEYARVMPAYDDDSGSLWTWPLVDLSDLIVDASMRLEESMRCEYKDFPKIILTEE
jgi:hypothetical protein